MKKKKKNSWKRIQFDDYQDQAQASHLHLKYDVTNQTKKRAHGPKAKGNSFKIRRAYFLFLIALLRFLKQCPKNEFPV
jgi:hypothetical protein